VSEYALRVVAVLPPTAAALTPVTDVPSPESDPADINPVNVAVLPIIEVEFTVTLPTLTLVVLIVATVPTLRAVVRLAVAGSLAVSSIPEEILVALIAVIPAPLPEIVVDTSAPKFPFVTVIVDELARRFTVELPMFNFPVSRLTLEPRLTIVVTLTVAGSLAVSRVPDVSVVALDAMTNAFEYAVAALAVTDEFSAYDAAAVPPRFSELFAVPCNVPYTLPVTVRFALRVTLPETLAVPTNCKLAFGAVVFIPTLDVEEFTTSTDPLTDMPFFTTKSLSAI